MNSLLLSQLYHGLLMSLRKPFSASLYNINSPVDRKAVVFTCTVYTVHYSLYTRYACLVIWSW